MTYFLFVTLILFTGCSSTTQDMSDKVLARIDGLSQRPEWFKESETQKIENGEIISLGSSTISADSRLEAAIRIAQNNAKAGMCSAIEQKLEFIFQNAEEGTQMDSNQVRFLGAEVCKLTSSNLKNDRIYWEKVSTSNNAGQRQIEYRVFATVKMPEVDLKMAILESLNKRAGKNNLSKTFLESVDKNWKKLTNE